MPIQNCHHYQKIKYKKEYKKSFLEQNLSLGLFFTHYFT
jgi:hypothetical protein